MCLPTSKHRNRGARIALWNQWIAAAVNIWEIWINVIYSSDVKTKDFVWNNLLWYCLCSWNKWNQDDGTPLSYPMCNLIKKWIFFHDPTILTKCHLNIASWILQNVRMKVYYLLSDLNKSKYMQTIGLNAYNHQWINISLIYCTNLIMEWSQNFKYSKINWTPCIDTMQANISSHFVLAHTFFRNDAFWQSWM